MSHNSNAGGFTQHEIEDMRPQGQPGPQGAVVDLAVAIGQLHRAFRRHGLGVPDLVLAEKGDVAKLGYLLTFLHESHREGANLPEGVFAVLSGASLYYPRPTE